ncbi:MAG: inorganic diphosphatase [Myxococcales bacterium]|nr:inorganic diphosphatase [Myxococcales bacterium]
MILLMNLLHHLPAYHDRFESGEDKVNAVIEIQEGASAKYEYDEVGEVFRLDRFLPNGLRFPINYGFVPETLAPDGDAVDILVHSSQPIERGTVVSVRVTGILRMTDDGETDDKVIAVPHCDSDSESFLDLSPERIRCLVEFFEIYKRKSLTGSEVPVTKVDGFRSAKDGLRAIEESRLRYRADFD